MIESSYANEMAQQGHSEIGMLRSELVSVKAENEKLKRVADAARRFCARYTVMFNPTGGLVGGCPSVGISGVDITKGLSEALAELDADGRGEG